MPSDGQFAFVPFCLSCCFPNIKELTGTIKRLRDVTLLNRVPVFFFCFVLLFSFFKKNFPLHLTPSFIFPYKLTGDNTVLTNSLGTNIHFFSYRAHFSYGQLELVKENGISRKDIKKLFLLCLIV